MIKGITNSITATLHERINSPLYGTYIFAWLAYNWDKALLLVFSDSKINDRVTIFKASMINDENGFDWCVVLVPLVVTGFILACQPFIQRWIFVHNERNKAMGFEKRDEFTAKTRLSHEQSAALRADVRELNKQHAEELTVKDVKIKQLESKLDLAIGAALEQEHTESELSGRIKSIEKESSKYKAGNMTLSDDLSKLQKQLTDKTQSLEKAKNYSDVGGEYLDSLRLYIDAVNNLSGLKTAGPNRGKKKLLSYLKKSFSADKGLSAFYNDAITKGITDMVIRASDFNSNHANLYSLLVHSGMGEFSTDINVFPSDLRARTLTLKLNQFGVAQLRELLSESGLVNIPFIPAQ